MTAGTANGNTENKPLKELEKKLESAKTPEKREAITQIRDLFRKYDRHYAAMDIVDYILQADRNVPVLAKLAEYAITEGSNTMVYVRIAAQAAKAPRADQEFLQLAELAKHRGSGHGKMTRLAEQAAQAKTDAELQAVRDKIAAMK